MWRAVPGGAVKALGHLPRPQAVSPRRAEARGPNGVLGLRLTRLAAENGLLSCPPSCRRVGEGMPEPPECYETIAGERGPRFYAAESSDGSAREPRMVADAALEILRRPDGEVVILSPAIPLSRLLVLDRSRLLPAPCCASIRDGLGAGVIKVEAPGTGPKPAAGPALAG